MINPKRETGPGSDSGEGKASFAHQLRWFLSHSHERDQDFIPEKSSTATETEPGSGWMTCRFINQPEETPCSERVVRDLIGMLSTQPDPQDRPLSKDLSSLGKLFGTLAESVEQAIITQDEAEALVELVLQGFVTRRFYKTLRAVAHPSSHSWLLTSVHHHQRHAG